MRFMESNNQYRWSEWEQAQKIHLSMDLILAAKDELRILALVKGTPALKKPEVLRRAIYRYLNCWLPLVNSYGEHYALIPPLDCAWIWHCHKLNPVQYGKDCWTLFQRLVDVKLSINLTPSVSLKRNQEEEVNTIKLWEEFYTNEPYNIVRFGESEPLAVESAQLAEDPGKKLAPSKVTYDLVAAAERQSSFYFQVCRPWFHDDIYLKWALKRYKGFLYLIKRAWKKADANNRPRPFIVPTYDIDLLWHAHQLCPNAYKTDMISLLDRVLHHDDLDADRSEGQKLDTSFLDTCELWYQTFGSVYEQAGAMYRGTERSSLPLPPLPEEAKLVNVDAKSLSQRMLSGSNRGLTKRETIQVQLVLLGARNLPLAPKYLRNRVYVRVTTLNKCPAFKLTTEPVDCTTEEIHWNEGFTLEAEMSTLGVRMELMISSSECDGLEGPKGGSNGLLSKTRPQCLGEVSITWSSYFSDAGSELSCVRWSNLVRKSRRAGSAENPKSTDPQIHFSLSVTPPTPAPYILHMKKSPATKDDRDDLQAAIRLPLDRQCHEGSWVKGIAVDHSGREQFVVRTSYSSGNSRNYKKPSSLSGERTRIEVYLAPSNRFKSTELGENLLQLSEESEAVGTAQLLGILTTPHKQQWSLSDGAAMLSLQWDEGRGLQCQLQGDVGFPLRLLFGNGVDSEMMTSTCVSPQCITLVRYTPDNPLGKATAIINWHSSSLQVMPDENVPLVLLITSAINVYLADMKQADVLPSTDPCVPSNWLVNSGQPDNENELGAVVLHKSGLSSKWRPKDRTCEPIFYSNGWARPATFNVICGLVKSHVTRDGTWGASCGPKFGIADACEGGGCVAEVTIGGGYGGGCGGRYGSCGSGCQGGGCGGGGCGGGCGSRGTKVRATP